jgi:hypothetical protein
MPVYVNPNFVKQTIRICPIGWPDQKGLKYPMEVLKNNPVGKQVLIDSKLIRSV